MSISRCNIQKGNYKLEKLCLRVTTRKNFRAAAATVPKYQKGAIT